MQLLFVPWRHAKKSFLVQKKFYQDVWRSCLSVEEERFNTSLSSSTSPPPQACPALARYQSSVRIENPTLSPILNYGKCDGIKMDVFSEKFQTAFDPPPIPHFWKIILGCFLQISCPKRHVERSKIRNIDFGLKMTPPPLELFRKLPLLSLTGKTVTHFSTKCPFALARFRLMVWTSA